MNQRRLELMITAQVGREYRDFIAQNLRALADLLPDRPESLSVAIVDDEAMSELHERFLGIPGSTDVLTFELDHDADGNVVEGEVVICLDEAQRQASTPAAVSAELLLYAVHGLLHLSGYDDRTPADFAVMHAKEDELLTAIGVGVVFSRD